MARPPKPNGDTILGARHPEGESRALRSSNHDLPCRDGATSAHRASPVAVLGKARLAWCALMPLQRLVTAFPLV
jgi:hypothetical protein